MASPTAVMMSETIKKEVVFSAECFDEGPKQLDASTQLIVEYSILALEAKYSGPGDWHDVHRKVDGTIDIVKGALSIGSFVFPPLAPVFDFISGVGSFFQWLMGKVPDNRPDPVAEKFKELEDLLHQLQDKMADQFADMKSFMSEENFDTNITAQAAVLMRFMRNCLQYRNDQDFENFSREYEKMPPLSMAYRMVSMLKNRATNPLLMAMEAENVKTRATFNKWKTIISGILGQLQFIEAFASGLLKKSTHDRERIVDKENQLKEFFEKWEEECKEDEEYWAEFKGDFEKYMADNKDLKNYQKANEILERLNNYLTHDSFYVCVQDDTVWKDDYYYHCPNENDQIAGSWHVGGCCAYVYRSREGWKKSEDELVTLRNNQNALFPVITKHGYFVEIINNEVANLPGYGFYCVSVPGRCGQEVRFSNDYYGGRHPGSIHTSEYGLRSITAFK